ncbi:MAG: AarF/UbiB family protein, partial [Candidatus Gracilibacteria bacterium]|nr:AarF/UbiB family protein [Candidatus Gracilibacteria bacterium]
DSNPTMNKLIFWHNLMALKKNGQGEINRKVLDSIVSVDDRAGAGSLFTTYFAKMATENGAPREVVIKLLSPNAIRRIKDSFKTLYLALGQIEKTSKNKQTLRNVKKTKEILRMTYLWCLKDVRDQAFDKEDIQFRGQAEKFNEQLGYNAVLVPEVLHNSQRLKVEERAKGIKLTKFLASPEYDASQKEEVQKIIANFYRYQMDNPISEKTFAGVPTRSQMDGEYLLHSDPHQGNFLVSFDAENRPQVSVIDRNLYIRLSEAEMRVFRQLREGQTASFLRNYVAVLAKRNKKGLLERAGVYTKLLSALPKIIASKGDKLESIIAIQDKLSTSGVKIPYWYELMIRNVQLLNQV